MAIGPQLKWIKSELEGKLYLVAFFILSILISFFIYRNLGTKILLNTILIGSAFYLFFITIRDFFQKNLKMLHKICHI